MLAPPPRQVRTASDILVVEDDDSIRRLLVDFLREQGIGRIQTARDGVEALHALATAEYAFVVLDIMMPKMTGIDLLSSLRTMHADPSAGAIHSLPRIVVVTSASEDEVDEDELKRRYGGLVIRVLRKPVDLGELGSVMRAEE